MEPIYEQKFEITDVYVDCCGRLRPSMILYFAQEVAGKHFARISMDYDSLEKQGLFWAITRHKVQITRLPRHGETIRIETWPMPTTRVAYPRSIVAYDEAGNEVFRAITLWVLMDLNNRSMVLPGKSGIDVTGTLRGNELASPLGLPAKALSNHRKRYVNFTDLDRNAHMNNTRYLDWIYDLLGAEFHREHILREFTLCYLNEAREGQQLELTWDFPEAGCLMMDAHRHQEDKSDRIFAAKLLFD
jgi:medium-chain acyl-[acyl-carrier-protein] hydrolase